MPVHASCRLNKPPLGTPRKIGQGCKWHSFTTNTYKLHFLESPSGIKVGAPATYMHVVDIAAAAGAAAAGDSLQSNLRSRSRIVSIWSSGCQ
jgi:hypothetical protein